MGIAVWGGGVVICEASLLVVKFPETGDASDSTKRFVAAGSRKGTPCI